MQGYTVCTSPHPGYTLYVPTMSCRQLHHLNIFYTKLDNVANRGFLIKENDIELTLTCRNSFNSLHPRPSSSSFWAASKTSAAPSIIWRASSCSLASKVALKYSNANQIIYVTVNTLMVMLLLIYVLSLKVTKMILPWPLDSIHAGPTCPVPLLLSCRRPSEIVRRRRAPRRVVSRIRASLSRMRRAGRTRTEPTWSGAAWSIRPRGRRVAARASQSCSRSRPLRETCRQLKLETSSPRLSLFEYVFYISFVVPCLDARPLLFLRN